MLREFQDKRWVTNQSLEEHLDCSKSLKEQFANNFSKHHGIILRRALTRDKTTARRLVARMASYQLSEGKETIYQELT